MIDLTDEEFYLFKDYLHKNCGIDVPVEKKYLFKTRLNEILFDEDLKSFKELYSVLYHDKNNLIKNKVIEFMTTNETSFFRDNHPFEILSNVILPNLENIKKSNSFFFPPQIKIWSAGCSTGQEPYSIAITIYEWLTKQTTFTPDRISIVATDISKKVLEKARKGTYDVTNLSKSFIDQYKNKYFRMVNNQIEFYDHIKKVISFEELNLSNDFTGKFANLDIIFCRNVIIYFSLELKRKIIEHFFKVLSSGGILILGASENLYKVSENFETIHEKSSTYYRARK